MNIKLDQINEPSKSYGQSVPKKNQSDKGDKDQEKDVDQIDDDQTQNQDPVGQSEEEAIEERAKDYDI